jgi:hypothetical protein
MLLQRALRYAIAAPAILVIAPGPAPAQGRYGEEPEIRVVETLDPSTLARTRQVVHDLTPQEILSIQKALRAAGYRLSWLTGQLDQPTRQALRAFQEGRGLVVCGCPSYETIVALGLRPSVIMTLIADARDASQAGSSYVAHDVAMYYPIPVPVLVPLGFRPGHRGPGGGGDGGDGEGVTGGPAGIPGGAGGMPTGAPGDAPSLPNRPGIRPPPPGRVGPAQGRVVSVLRGPRFTPRIVH